MVQFYIVSLFY